MTRHGKDLRNLPGALAPGECVWISTICLLETVRLLKHDEVLRAMYNRNFEFVMIDEYQDTNASQYQLMRLLTEDETECLRGWRRRSIHLRMARCGYSEHSGF